MSDKRDVLWKDEMVPRVLEHVPIGFMLVSIPPENNNFKRPRICEVNNEFLRIFNLTKKECVDHTLEEVFPERAPSWISLVKKSLSTAQPVRAQKFLKDIQKHIQLVVFSTQDNLTVFLITDRSKEQTAIRETRRLQDQLIHSQKMEDIGNLAGGIAHDFNNLITAIHGYAEVALIQNENREYQEDCLKQILLTAQRAANLTQQLLFFSRKKPMEKRPYNLSKIIQELLSMLKRIIGEHIRVNLKLEPRLPLVELDRGQIEQVVMNLAINARDAMEGGGELRVRTTVVDINAEYSRTYQYARPGTYVCMVFEDTGTGMDQQTITKVFEPFFTTKKGGKGTGLGLSLVYSIIKDHGGWIHAYSEPGKGSSFKIYLPVTSLEQKPEKKPVEMPAVVQGRGENVLFVEDDRDIYRFVKSHLSKSGYTVFAARTVHEAIELFKKQNNDIDILITDVVLPDKSGIELARLLLTKNPELKVFLTSGYLDREEDWELIDDKTYRFIQKPYSLTDLLRAVGESTDIPR